MKIIMRTIDYIRTLSIACIIVVLSFTLLKNFLFPNASEHQFQPFQVSAIDFEDFISQNDIQSPYPNYLRNEYGQTYGNGYDLPDDPYNSDIISLYPELLAAVGADGKIGYIYMSDVDTDKPNNPEEAVKHMEKMTEDIANGVTGKKIPLYDVDGRTVIGEFEMQYN